MLPLSSEKLFLVKHMLHPDNLHGVQTSECSEYKYDTEFRKRKLTRLNGICFRISDL